MNHSLPRPCLTLAAVLALASAAAAQDPAERAASALYDGIRAETLDNGLRVYLKAIPDAPVVSVMVAYKVGSADEDLDHTGLSHYLEPLMFKGTDKNPQGLFSQVVATVGGQENAFTTSDYTGDHTSDHTGEDHERVER